MLLLPRHGLCVFTNESSDVSCNWTADRYETYEREKLRESCPSYVRCAVIHINEKGVLKQVHAVLGHERSRRWMRFKAFNVELSMSLAQ